MDVLIECAIGLLIELDEHDSPRPAPPAHGHFVRTRGIDVSPATTAVTWLRVKIDGPCAAAIQGQQPEITLAERDTAASIDELENASVRR